MIVNGTYVKYDESSAAKLQTTINKSEDLKADLKSEIERPKEVTDMAGEVNSAFGFGYNSLMGFEGSSGIAQRKAMYDIYTEMDNMEFIHRALEVVADDSTLDNSDGDVLKVYSDNEEIKDLLYDLFVHRLDMNNELWTIVYDTAKMGDNFYEVIPDSYKKPTKIIYLRYLEPGRVERIEKDGKLSHFEYSPEEEKRKEHDRSEKTQTIYRLQPWQIVHFKVQTDRDTDPYGGSLLKSGIRTYRRLSLLEDVILVYRISRAPERRVFRINVGNMNAVEARRFIQKVKSQYRSQNFIDENGNINKKANMLSITSDIFVPVREGEQGTQIETLTGGDALKTIEDLDYFKDKILRTINIPPAYLGDDADRSRGNLSQQDVKTARFIERVQSQIKKGLNKIAALELFFNGQKKEDLKDFKIELTPPSNIKELTEIDLINQRMNLIATIQGLNIYSMEWVLKNIMKHTDREIADIKMQKAIEAKTGAGQGGEEGATGFGGMEPDMGGLEGGAAGGEETPAPEAPAPEAPAPEAGAAEGLTASTVINMFGKEFIMENQEDFFKLVKASEKYLKEEGKNEISPILESVVRIINSPTEQKDKNNKTNFVRRLFALNEMGGITLEKDKRSMKLYEKTKELKEKEILLS